MANADNPRGLTPLKTGAGEIRTNLYYVPNSVATAIAVGDPVIKNGSADSNGIPGVTRATVGTGNRITGGVTGVLPTHPSLTTDPDLYKSFLEVSTAGYVLVADDPFQYFMIQDDGSVVLSAGNIGQNADLISGHAFNSTTGRSKLEIEASGTATTASMQFQIVGLVQRPDNALGANADWVVKPNFHTELPDGGRTGI